MLSRFFTGAEPRPPEPAVVTAEIAVPLEQSAPAAQRGWVDHLHGAVESTWQSGSALGSQVASGASAVAGSVLSTATSTATQISNYGLDAAGLAVTRAGGAVRTVGSAAEHIGGYGAEVANVAGRAVVEAGRFGGAAAIKVGDGAGWAASGVGRIGSGIIDGIVVTPATAATRTAATVAHAAIVQPARAVRSFVLTVLFTLCGTVAFVAVCAAVAMFFYSGGFGPNHGLVAVPQPQPLVIVLPQPGQPSPGIPVAPSTAGVLPAAVPELKPVLPLVPAVQRAATPEIQSPTQPGTTTNKPKAKGDVVAPRSRNPVKVAEPVVVE